MICHKDPEKDPATGLLQSTEWWGKLEIAR